MERPLTLISAPAGSGKTTLLAQWIAGENPPGPLAWLRLGREDADRRRFWVSRYGRPVRSLLRRLIARGSAHRPLAGELLLALDEPRTSNRAPVTARLDPLSERELSVLRFLPTMMSNAEIAAEMFVSVNTVKTHLKHVYRKLDVTDRRDCVDCARELRLLSPGLSER